MEFDDTIADLKKQLLGFLDTPKYNFSSEIRSVVPPNPGVYAVYKRHSIDPIYVGQTKNLRRRIFNDHLTGDKIGSAFRRNLSDGKNLESEKDITKYILDFCEFQFEQHDEISTKQLEYFAIAVLRPCLNK